MLGTLPPEERAAFARALDGDAGLRALVAGWEARLAPLAVATPPVAPSPATWAGIAARIGGTPGAVGRGADHPLGAGGAALARGGDGGGGARGGPRPVDRRRAASGGEGAQYLAVVDRGGALPALIVRVDLGSGLVQVRSLAAETPPDRSLELWYVGRGRRRARSAS